MYSVRRMTDGAWIESFWEWSMWPLCSSTRATPLKIMTTARLSVHTLIGSKEVFRTKTLPFILGLILRERGRECQNMWATGVLTAGNGQDKDVSGAGRKEGCGAGGDGCPGGEDVVNEEDVFVGNQPGLADLESDGDSVVPAF